MKNKPPINIPIISNDWSIRPKDYSIGSVGCYAERLKQERNFIDKLKCIPYIIKAVFKSGWLPGDLKRYWKYKAIVAPSLSGLSMLDIGA